MFSWTLWTDHSPDLLSHPWPVTTRSVDADSWGRRTSAQAGLELLSAELQDLKRRSGVEEATAASSRRDRREQQKIWRQRILHKEGRC